MEHSPWFSFIFQNLGASRAPAAEAPGGAACDDLPQAVERVVDEISVQLRSIHRYASALIVPVSTTFEYIDKVVENTPGAISCRRSTFIDDPRVNAFFSSPQHLQEVFSHSEAVHQLFQREPEARECWALLCMRKEERKKIGMAVVEGTIRKDVLQTVVNFTDHQVISPAANEPEARCALKCCIFKSLLAHIREKVTSARTRSDELGSRLRSLQGQLRRLKEGRNTGGTLLGLQEDIDQVEGRLAMVEPRLETTEDLLQYLVDTFSNPGEFIQTETRSMRLNRLGTRIEADSTEPGYELDLSEIKVASREPRISAMVRFPRDELLPQDDFVEQANLFLSM